MTECGFGWCPLKAVSLKVGLPLFKMSALSALRRRYRGDGKTPVLCVVGFIHEDQNRAPDACWTEEEASGCPPAQLTNNACPLLSRRRVCQIIICVDSDSEHQVF